MQGSEPHDEGKQRAFRSRFSVGSPPTEPQVAVDTRKYLLFDLQLVPLQERQSTAFAWTMVAEQYC